MTKNRSIALICGSLQNKGSKTFNSSWVALLATTPEGQMYTEQVFPDQESIIITDNGQPVTRDPKMNVPASFEWKSSMGVLRFNRNVSSINFTFPSGLVFRMTSETRVPWDASCPDSCGPEGWIGIVPKALPTHYFIQSLASDAHYEFNGSKGDGFAHQETNFGSRFPVAWVWIQGISQDGKNQLVVTGGDFTIAGLTIRQFLIGLRTEERQWNFRAIDLDKITGNAEACNNYFELHATSRDGSRRIELKARAPSGTFSEPLYFPTVAGWSNTPGAEESYFATVEVRLYEGSDNVPVEELVLASAALEFGGTFRCIESHPQEISHELVL